MAYRPYGPGTPPAQELAARAAAAAGLQESRDPSSSDASRKRRDAEAAGRESLRRALDGIEDHYERLLVGALWVTEQHEYKENPDQGVLGPGWIDPEDLLFAVLWPEGVPDTFPDQEHPWETSELGRWFAKTARARGIVPANTVERRREYVGLFGKRKVKRSREPAWTVVWTVGARLDKPGHNLVHIFTDGHVQPLLLDGSDRLEIGGLASMARILQL